MLSGCRVLRAFPSQNEAVLSWLESSKYEPLLLDGEPFACDYRIQLDVTLGDTSIPDPRGR
jgi:hypothetical protein